jgi:ParB family chromosome partitioning protein
MDIGKVFTDSIIIGPRHRPMDASRIEALAESINELGLQQPISVHMDDEDRVHLIAGLHRLEAARKLGWEQIEASFVTLSPIKREMWEIAENLFRVDLSKEQRDQHIRRYAELIEAAEAEDKTRRSVAFSAIGAGQAGPGRGNKGTARKVAEETGISVRTVQRVLNPQPVKIAPEPDDDFQAHERQVSALMSAWNRASPEARRDFMARIDTPVFDRGAA